MILLKNICKGKFEGNVRLKASTDYNNQPQLLLDLPDIKFFPWDKKIEFHSGLYRLEDYWIFKEVNKYRKNIKK